ncbi:TonB family protein [Microbaculum marinum]|uniref:TonB family protein n=1 Tax=Microbaculum marinum TaxID=1764581 RepID=A0AAW9RG42_9HYPH
MIGPVQWIVAGALAIVLHGAVLAFAWSTPDISLEGSSGQPGAVWGMPVETIADTVDPTQAAASAASPVEATEPVEETEPTDMAEPVEPTDADPVELAEPVEQAEAREDVAPARPDTARTVDAAEAVDAAPQEAVAPDTTEATEVTASTETPSEADQPSTPAWEGGIAVAAPAPSPQESEPVEETRVAALTPVSEAAAVEATTGIEAVTATDVTIPVPPLRPADVPRVTAPPKPAVSKPAPAKPAPQAAPKSTNPAPSASSTRTASAPAGEQAGSTGSRSASSGRQLITSYAGKVASHLQRHKRYPAGTERGQTGTATITFTIGADGRVRGARLSRSSGVGPFDQEVVAMVSRAAPFPPIPSAIGKSSMTFTVPIRFQPR